MMSTEATTKRKPKRVRRLQRAVEPAKPDGRRKARLKSTKSGKSGPAVVALLRRNDLPGAPLEMTPAGVKLVHDLAAKGATNSFIAQALNVTKETFGALRERQPEIIDALNAGRAVDENAVQNRLRECALDGQFQSMQFYLKVRHGWREGDSRDVNITNRITVNQQVNVEEFSRDVRDDLRRAALKLLAAQSVTADAAPAVIDVPSEPREPEPQGEGENHGNES